MTRMLAIGGFILAALLVAGVEWMARRYRAFPRSATWQR